MNIQRKAAQSAATEVNEDEGVVVAVVSVTGTVDSVRDVIEPGAYTKTLAARRPKVVWSHDWNTPIGRVDEIKELLPGDPHLPKTQPNGDPWPAEAGALVVKAMFNLDTQRGRESFSDVKFYGQDGAWSIGYNVPVGGSTVESKTGIRRIKELDLYEVSPVLHGAHAMAGTQFVKALPGGGDAPVMTDTASVGTGASSGDGDGADAESPAEDAADLVCELCAGVEPRPGTAICLRCDGPMESPADEAAGNGDDPAGIPDATDAATATATEGKALAHESLDHSPKKNWVEESGQLPAYIQHIAKDLHEERGMDLSHAIAVAISRVKKWAAGGDNVKPDTRAKAAKALAEWEALKAKNAARHTASTAKSAEAHVKTETKWFSGITGTVEQRLDAIRRAVRDSLTPINDPAEMMTADPTVPTAAPYTWVDVLGTYDDYVIATVEMDGQATETYRVPYVIDADGGVELGVATAVDIQTVVVPKDSVTLEVDDFEDPTQLAMGLEKSLQRAMQTKAGRVLSGSNESRLRSVVQELVSILQSAGVSLDDQTAVAQEKALLETDEVLEFELLKLVV